MMDLIAELQAAAEAADRVLDERVYAASAALFERTLASPAGLAALQAAAPEYGRPEYLVCVWHDGSPAPQAAGMLADFRAACVREGRFAGWLQERRDGDGRSLLLPARWLCHLAGLRHQTVQAFIQEGAYWLVQVRGLDRPEAPGSFDMPVAGHVAGLAPTGEAMAGELNEELGLTLDDVSRLTCLGHYDYVDPARGVFRNHEWRTVFACQLKPGSLARIHFADGEVAAICLFERSQLAALIERFPERVASGLLASFREYGPIESTGNGG